MAQIQLAYGLPNETVTAIKILYKNTNTNIRFPAGDRLLRHCCLSSAQRCILAPHLLIICPDYVLRASIDLIKEKKMQEVDDDLQKLLQT